LATLKKDILFYLPALVLVLANCLLLSNEVYWLAAVPAVLFIVWLTFYKPKLAILALAFFAPISLKMDFKDYGLSLSVPTEPIIISLLFLFFLKILMGGEYDWRIMRQPLSLLLIVSLVWIFITACTSTMFIVSIKSFIARLWFITIAYFIAVQFLNSLKYVIAFVSLFTFSLAGVVVYALVRHNQWHWVQGFATYTPRPFFSDHGDYAAIVAFFIPIVLIFAIKRRVFGFNRVTQVYFGLLAALFSAGVLFSYTRAAWLSLAVAAVFLVIFMLKIRFSYLLMSVVIIVSVLVSFQYNIYSSLRKNKTVSTTDFASHVASATNISTDASNTERINRWQSAFRMYNERPIFGFGPGTYMFKYAPYQLYSEMTIISTNTGSLGNAHSEYIGPLAESGFLGIVSVILLFGGAIWKGMQIIYRTQDERVKQITIGITLGLITYFVHGFVNDYLERDKAAIPFFAFFAILTAMDLYHVKNEKRKMESEKWLDNNETQS